MRRAGVWCVWAACFCIPLSTSLLGVFSGLATLCWLLSGSFRQAPAVCRRHPALLFALLLFVLLAVGLSYSAAEPADALDALKKYRELLLLPVMVSLLSVHRQAGQRAEQFFVAGCLTLMLISWAMALNLVPSERYGNSLLFHITHSFFMAVLAYWALIYAANRQPHRLLWIAVFLAATANLFYIAPGRTGMFIYLCLMLLFIMQRLSRWKRLSAIALLVIALIGFYGTSTNFSQRIELVAQEIAAYQPGQARSSIGQRFDWWMASLHLIAERPLLGHGTGSFLAAQQQQDWGSDMQPSNNPHNEYLFLAVQVGVPGLVLFLAILLCQWREGLKLSPEKKDLMQGVLTALYAGSLMNSLLFDSHQGHFYLFMSAALMATGVGPPVPADSVEKDSVSAPL